MKFHSLFAFRRSTTASKRKPPKSQWIARAIKPLIESMERRMLLSASPAAYAIPADGAHHDLTLSLDVTGQLLQLTDTDANQVLSSQPIASVSEVIVTGAATNTDKLTIDLSNGVFNNIPVFYDGGASSVGSSLTVTASSASGVATQDVYTPGPAVGAGELVATSSGASVDIHFTDLGSVQDLAPGTLTVNGTSGNDAITYSAGTASPSTDGLIAVNNFTPVEFSNKSAIVINTGSGTDAVTYNEGVTPTGLTGGVQVNAGNSTSTLAYAAASATSQISITPAQGYSGQIVSGADQMQYSDFPNISVKGSFVVGVQLDIEPSDATSPWGRYTVSQGNGVGSGTISGFSYSPSDQPEVIYLPTITYSALEPTQGGGLVFGANTPLTTVNDSVSSVTYNPQVGDNLYFAGSAFSEVLPGGGESNKVTIDGTASVIFNVTTTQYVQINSNTNDIYVDGTGTSSLSILVFGNLGAGDVNINNFTGDLVESGYANVYYRGINSIAVYSLGTITTTGIGSGNSVTVTPTGADTIIKTDAFDPTLRLISPSLVIDPRDASAPVIINGDGGNDVITAFGDGSNGAAVQVGDTQIINLVPGDEGTLTINGGNGNDTLVVDSSNGPFDIPIAFAGGIGTNVIEFTGGAAQSDIYTPGAAPNAGSDVLGFDAFDAESVAFAGVSTVLDDVAGPLVINGAGGNDSMTYQPSIAPFDLNTDAEVAFNSVDSIQFSNKSTLTLDAGAASDAITINNNTTPTALTGITVSGGAGVDVLTANAFDSAVPASALSTAGTLDLPGQLPVTYTGIESIQIINGLEPISATPVTLSGSEGTALKNVVVASFTGGPLSGSASDLSASINWGDGTSSVGTIVAAAGGYNVIGSHTYSEEGVYKPAVAITPDSTKGYLLVGGVPVSIAYLNALTPQTVAATINIADPAVVAVTDASAITSTAAVSTGTVTLATFTDPGGAEPVGDYSASINWGDGSAGSTGVITFAGGVFTVKSSHTYPTAKTYYPTVVIHHDSAPASNTVTDTVIVNPAESFVLGPVALAGHVGQSSGGVIGRFTVLGANPSAADFTAVVDWGDKSSPTAATVVSNGGGHFTLMGTHTYSAQGNDHLTIAVTQNNGAKATIASTDTIFVSPLDTLAGVTLTKTVNTTFSNVVIGTFRDQNALNAKPAAYAGVIAWGDGTTSAATFVYNGASTAGSFWKIEGSHKYLTKSAAGKPYKVTITFHEVGATLAASVISSSITVT